jgi:hypothetical protein
MPPRIFPPPTGEGPKRFTDYTWIQATSPTTIILVVTFLVLLLVGLVAIRVIRERRRKRTLIAREIDEIRQTCIQKKLDEGHADFLLHLAQLGELDYPSRIVKSIITFDRCVGRFIDSLPSYRKRRDDPDVQKLSQIRVRLGFHEALAGKYLPTTRELSGGEQFLIKIAGRDVGRFFRASVIDVDEIAITISYLDDAGIPVPVYTGEELDVRFTRLNDGEYAFMSKIIERRDDLQVPGYTIEHATTLRRTAKRGDLRVKVRIPIRFYRIEIVDMEALEKKRKDALKWKPIIVTPEEMPSDGEAFPTGFDGSLEQNQRGGARMMTTEDLEGSEGGIPADGMEEGRGETEKLTVPKNPWTGLRSGRKKHRRGKKGEEEVFVKEDLDGVDLFSATIMNVGRGGASIISEHYIPQGEFLRFDPNYRGEFPVGGLIAQVLRLETMRDGQYRFNLKFVRMLRATSEKLGKKVLERDREESLKRAGLA